jgi:hypothetical protein
MMAKGFSIFLLALLGGFASAAPTIGYLPVVGPAPLRFIIAPRVLTNQFRPVLPPPEPARVFMPTEPIQPPPAEPAVVHPQEPARDTPAAATPLRELPMEAAPADEVVSPQMFLKFFNKSINISNSVAAPVDFMPPKIAEPPVSKATYSTGP